MLVSVDPPPGSFGLLQQARLIRAQVGAYGLGIDL
jgi:hypothetical protein